MRIKLDDDATSASTFAPTTVKGGAARGGRGMANGWGREQGTAAVMWVLLLMAHVHKFMITYDTKRMMKRLKGKANRRGHMQQASVQQNSSHF